MGRVYKALLKADRWNDAQRPIGRPPVERIAPVPPRTESDMPDFGALSLADSEGPDSVGLIDVNAGFALSETRAEAFPVESRTRFVSYPRAVDSPGDQIVFGASSQEEEPPPMIFEEPSCCLTVSPVRVAPHLAAVSGSDLLACERYRTLAVRMLNLTAHRKLKTVVITSAEDGEGKSTVATNLAWVLARPRTRRVLLIDADLRKPSIAGFLGISTRGGRREFLENRASFAEALVRVDPNGLYVMTAAAQRASSNNETAVDPLLPLNLEELLVRIEHMFDLILIDSPALLDSADAQRLAVIADGTILVTRAGRTHHARVTDALTLVPADRKLGIVLNESEIDDHRGRRQHKRFAGRLLRH